MNRGIDSASGALVVLAAVLAFAAVIWGAMALGTHFAGPCDGARTGPQTYHGTRIICFHGDVVRVLGRAR